MNDKLQLFTKQWLGAAGRIPLPCMANELRSSCEEALLHLHGDIANRTVCGQAFKMAPSCVTCCA